MNGHYGFILFHYLMHFCSMNFRQFKISVCCFLLFILQACTTDQNQKSLNNLDWLIGTWQGQSRSGNVFYEEWIKSSPKEFINHNYHFENDLKIKGGSSKIILQGEEIYYINDTDSSKQLRWKAIDIQPASVTFGNDSIKPYNHISFSLSSQNTWDAKLTGVKDTITYSLKRIR